MGRTVVRLCAIPTTGNQNMRADREKRIFISAFPMNRKNWKDWAPIIKLNQGLVIILVCAHRGIINTLYHAQQITGTGNIHMVAGGAHLMNAPEERLQNRPQLGSTACVDPMSADWNYTAVAVDLRLTLSGRARSARLRSH